MTVETVGVIAYVFACAVAIRLLTGHWVYEEYGERRRTFEAKGHWNDAGRANYEAPEPEWFTWTFFAAVTVAVWPLFLSIFAASKLNDLIPTVGAERAYRKELAAEEFKKIERQVLDDVD